MVTCLAQTDWWTAGAAWFAAIVALVYTGVTVWLALETHWLRKAQVEELVVVQADQSPFGGKQVDLVLANAGGRPVYDVSLSPSRPIVRWDTEGTKTPLTGGWIEHGVDCLHRGAILRTAWGSVSQVRSFLGEHELKVEVSYRVSRFGRVRRSSHEVTVRVLSEEGSLPNPVLDQAISLRRMTAALEESVDTTSLIYKVNIAAAIKTGALDAESLRTADEVIKQYRQERAGAEAIGGIRP